MAVPPAYTVSTPRLQLRCWDPGDAEGLFATVEDNVKHLGRYLAWVPNRPTSVDAQVAVLRRFRVWFDRGEQYFYGAFDPSTGEVLGGIGLHHSVGPDALEIGYWLTRHRIGQGLATEMVSALIRVAFEIEDAQRVEIRCSVSNLASVRIPQRLGFEHEATLPRRLPYAKGVDDMMIWSLWVRDYRRSQLGKLAIDARDGAGRRLL
ncbi:MAG TPA: GNAT family N-acetyltransferase [Kofleriaceae bacterium]|nr:GNAT family N-acetyltransferase [Kofleriaceae bacterium]